MVGGRQVWRVWGAGGVLPYHASLLPSPTQVSRAQWGAEPPRLHDCNETQWDGAKQGLSESQALLPSSSPATFHPLPSSLPKSLVVEGPLTIQSELVKGRDGWQFIFSLLLWYRWRPSLRLSCIPTGPNAVVIVYAHLPGRCQPGQWEVSLHSKHLRKGNRNQGSTFSGVVFVWGRDGKWA